MKKILFFSSIVAIAFFACYNDSEEALYPSLSNNCDTTNVTYIATIKPKIMDFYCNGCHSNSNAANMGGGIKLETYTTVKGNASTIFDDINSGRMPKGGSKISSCNILQFDNWIKHNMPEK